jgi:hypothetical protein
VKPDVRDRLVLPLLIPLGLLGVLAAIALGFGMLLLFNPMTISLMIAIVVSAGILAAFGMESAARPEEQTRPKRAVISLAIVAPLALGLLVAVDIIPVDARKMVDVEPFLAIPEDAPVVVARDLLFGAGVDDPHAFLGPLATNSASNAAERGAERARGLAWFRAGPQSP